LSSDFFWGAGIVTGPFFRCPLGRISKARAGRSKNPPNFLSASLSTATAGSESIARSQNMCFLTGGKGFWFSVTAFSESAQEFRGRAPNFKMRPGDQGRKIPVVGHQRPTTGFTFEICWTCDPRKRGRSCPRLLNHVLTALAGVSPPATPAALLLRPFSRLPYTAAGVAGNEAWAGGPFDSAWRARREARLGGLSPELLKPLGQLTRAILHRRTNCKHGYAGLCPVFLYRRPGTLGPDQWLSSTDSGPGVHPGDAGSNPCLPPRRTSML
jgi:hypothetical protein